MKIGILGSGVVGKALAHGFTDLGHEVKIGTRQEFAGIAKFGEVLVVATLWAGTENALKLAGPENFAGKVVIDATNPIVFDPGKTLTLSVGTTDSGGEQVQRWLPGAKVVKAFNTVGAALMYKPQLAGGPPDMFICGNDASAKEQVGEILKAFGWGSVDAGGIESSRWLEAMCALWLSVAVVSGNFNQGYKMLKGH